MFSTTPVSSAADTKQVKTSNGVLEGTVLNSGIRAFRGIPFAQPPVGDLRWKPPQPAKNWTGVRPAVQFGPRCVQDPIFGDMNFRANGMSEDCLYLNVWTPARNSNERLPVLVYFFGGGFVAGDGSEPRYDGESMARKGIVALTVNYRLGVFGLMAHPELTKESPHHASGNYGLLDQNAALRWVQQNIAAFGGDPNQVTIAGESAGSISVSAQMASPLSKGLFARALGESGSIMGALSAVPLAQAEQAGTKLASIAGATSLAALRALSADQIQQAARKADHWSFRIGVDGYFFPESPDAIFASGKQAHVPLLVGGNSAEMNYSGILQRQEPTPENYQKAVRKLYGAQADSILRLYPGTTKDLVLQSATDLASDRFIALSTWKWADLCAKTGGNPVFHYLYFHPRPPMKPEMGDAAPGLAGGVVRGPAAKAEVAPPAHGAVHAAEIEYVMGNLSTNHVFAWTPADYKVSQMMQDYFANFIKTGNPNGSGLAHWPAFNSDSTRPIMHLDIEPKAEPDKHEERYRFLEKLAAQ